LVFVEVKTRSSTAFGQPENFVSRRQEAKIRQGAEEYIFKEDWHGPIRFDIVSVVMGKSIAITHFEDAIH
jgi:putative endonuclease